jgi:hypothetical protein
VGWASPPAPGDARLDLVGRALKDDMDPDARREGQLDTGRATPSVDRTLKRRTIGGRWKWTPFAWTEASDPTTEDRWRSEIARSRQSDLELCHSARQQ